MGVGRVGSGWMGVSVACAFTRERHKRLYAHGRGKLFGVAAMGLNFSLSFSLALHSPPRLSDPGTRRYRKERFV